MKKILIILCFSLLALSLFAQGTIIVWGSPHPHVQTQVPAGDDFIQVSGGKDYALALKQNGEIRAWGSNSHTLNAVPTQSGFIAISAGEDHALALHQEGWIAAWGKNHKGQTNVPAGNDFVKISAGILHNLALKANGEVIAWGSNDSNQCNVPAGTYKAIAAGNANSLAIKTNGEITGWGNAFNGEFNYPAGNDFKDVQIRFLHGGAMKEDGSIVAWGNNFDNANAPTDGPYKALAVGYQGNVALRADGYLYSWGNLWALKNEQMPAWVRDLEIGQVGAGDKFLMAITAPDAEADSDDDGVADSLDQYPDDALRAYDLYYPQGTETGWGTLAFEDMWPQKGDYDFNDLVLGYQLQLVLDAELKVKDIIGRFKLRAVGASFQNAFAIEFPFSEENVQHFVSHANEQDFAMPFTPAGDKLIIKVISNTNDLVQLPGGGVYWNTQPEQPHYEPIPLGFTLTLAEAIKLSELEEKFLWNPFLLQQGKAGHEIHLPGYPPTIFADSSLFGKNDDTTDPANGRYYKTQNNLPWALDLPLDWKYPIERREISHAYLGFGPWAESGGALYQNWYELLPFQIRPEFIYNP